MPLPETLLADLESIPRDRSVALLMRHSQRFPITDPANNYTVGLTEEGFQMAGALGARLRQQFRPGRVMSSPVGRCRDTAWAIAAGANWPVEVAAHPLLSHEHIASAWSLAETGRCGEEIPHEVLATLDFLLEHAPGGPLLEVMVTHDTIVGAVVGCVLKEPVLGEHWPDFLEGVFVWKDEDGTHLLWRGSEKILVVGLGR